MSDSMMVPFHVWGHKNREEALDRSNALSEMCKKYITGSDLQIFANNIAWLMESHATLLNVLATEAAERYEADVKGQQKSAARPPDDYPQLRMYVFQRTEHQMFAFGLSESGARHLGKIPDDAKCIGWH